VLFATKIDIVSPAMGSTDDAAPTTQMPRPPGWPDSRNLVIVRSLGVFFLGISTLLLSWITYKTQTRNTERDIDLKQRTLEFQTGVEAAKLGISVIPMLSCEDDIKRASAFRIFETFSPSAGQAKNIAQVLSAKCPNLSLQARSEISDFQKRTSLQQSQSDFRRVLANAREYRANGFDGRSARLFYEARDLLTDTAAARQVDFVELEKAKTAYEEGNFSEASGHFQNAFSRIP
jgi:hypothetical protein